MAQNDDPLRLTLGLAQTPAIAAAPLENPLIRKLARQPATRSVRRRKDKGNSERITPPYPWASDRPCRFETLEELKSSGHVSVTGTVTCKKCGARYEMAFDLGEKFAETGGYFLRMKEEMRHRATEEWTKPMLPRCKSCGEKNAAVPEIAGKEKTNWLFLFLGQLIGCCKFQDLKYFLSKHYVHRTAAKNRLVYLVYFTICKQLDPTTPFDL